LVAEVLELLSETLGRATAVNQSIGIDTDTMVQSSSDSSKLRDLHPSVIVLFLLTRQDTS
jgi:hypothetical protein